MYIKKFYDMDMTDTGSGQSETETQQEVLPGTEEQVSIAAMMAKQGVKTSTEGEGIEPVRLNRDGSWGSKSKEDESPVDTTKDESSKEEAAPESSSERETAPVPEPQIEEEPAKVTDWQETIKAQAPENVLKALGFDEKTISFISELKEIDPKMVGFLNTWKEGGDVKEYLNEASKDYSTMPAEDVMRHQLRLDYPKATEAQLEVLYKKEVVEKYSLNSYDEDEVNEGKLLLDAKADKFRDELIRNQQEKLLPSSSAYSEQQKQEEQRIAEFSQRIVNDFNENPFTKEVLSKNSITIGEGADKFSFPINAKEVADLAIHGDKNGDLMFERKVDANGQESFVPRAQHQLLVATVSKYGEKFITELAKHYKSLGGKAAIDPIDNARPSGSKNTPNSDEKEPTTIAGAMAKYGKLQSGGW